jgi:hypothetical protein
LEFQTSKIKYWNFKIQINCAMPHFESMTSWSFDVGKIRNECCDKQRLREVFFDYDQTRHTYRQAIKGTWNKTSSTQAIDVQLVRYPKTEFKFVFLTHLGSLVNQKKI